MDTSKPPNAVVIDTGSYSTKIGFAGEDEPQSIVRTIANNKNKAIDPTLVACDDSKSEIIYPYSNGIINNIDALTSIWMKSLKHNLRLTETDISSSPILLSEPSYWSHTNIFSSLFMKFRENYTSLIFEKFNSPSMYLCKDAVLSSFAHGFKSSIVLDLGGGSTKCTPIYDGYVINKGVKVTKCSGNYFDKLIYAKLKSMNIGILPFDMNTHRSASYTNFKQLSVISDLRETVFRIRNTKFDVANLPFAYKVNDSYATTQNKSFNPPMSTMNAPKSPSVKMERRSRSTSPKIKMERSLSLNPCTNDSVFYTLPDGTRLSSEEWMYPISELMFTDYHKEFEYDLMDEWIDKMQQMDMMKMNVINNEHHFGVDDDGIKYRNRRKVWLEKDYEKYRFKGLASMIVEALHDCDVDIRTLCMKNVVICGGHSLYKGFIERLGKDLSVTVPYAYKYKLHFNDTPRERVFSPWLGGSILCSTSSFQNMWITKEEYAECGKASIVHRKCP